MRTEDQFYEDHLENLINTIIKEVSAIENRGELDDQDEMELEALDRLMRDLEGL